MPIKTLHCQCLPIQQKMIENYQLFGFSEISGWVPRLEKHYLAQLAWQDIDQKTWHQGTSQKSPFYFEECIPREREALDKAEWTRLFLSTLLIITANKSQTVFTDRARIEKELSVMNGQLIE